MRRFLIGSISLLLVLCPVLAAAQNAPEGMTREQALSRARYLKSIYKTESAIDLLSSFVTAESFDEEILNELAECHLQSGDDETAMSTYSMLSAKNPSNVLYKVKQMNISYRMKDYYTCAQKGMEISLLDTIPALVSLTGDAFNQMQQTDSALVWYRRYMEINPYNPKVIGKIARIYLDRKQYPEVMDLVDAYLAEDPDNMDIRAIKGLAYYLRSDYKRSEEVFQKMEDDGNDSYNVHFYLGQTMWHNNRHGSAAKELEKAWQIDSSDVNLAYTIAAVNSEIGRRMDVVGPWLDKALDMILPDPATLSRIYRQYGRGYSLQQDFRKSLDYYLKAYDADVTAYAALTNIGYCYEQLKDYENARKYYELYLKVSKPGSESYNFAKESLDYVKQQLFMEQKK